MFARVAWVSRLDFFAVREGGVCASRARAVTPTASVRTTRRAAPDAASARTLWQQWPENFVISYWPGWFSLSSGVKKHHAAWTERKFPERNDLWSSRPQARQVCTRTYNAKIAWRVPLHEPTWRTALIPTTARLQREKFYPWVHTLVPAVMMSSDTHRTLLTN